MRDHVYILATRSSKGDPVLTPFGDEEELRRAERRMRAAGYRCTTHWLNLRGI